MEKNSFELDESVMNSEMGNSAKITMSKDAIPDMVELVDKINDFITFIESDEKYGKK